MFPLQGLHICCSLCLKDTRLIYSPLPSPLNATSSQRAFLPLELKRHLSLPHLSLSALLCLVFPLYTHTLYSLSGCIYSSFPSHTCSQINPRCLAHCRYFIHVFLIEWTHWITLHNYLGGHIYHTTQWTFGRITFLGKQLRRIDCVGGFANNIFLKFEQYSFSYIYMAFYPKL